MDKAERIIDAPMFQCCEVVTSGSNVKSVEISAVVWCRFSNSVP